MKSYDLKSMSVDELWSLREAVALNLARKIAAEKARLELRLRQLGLSTSAGVTKMDGGRRSYPKVYPKYRNPAQPAETWAGRGKQPRWLVAELRTGKKLDDFRIPPTPVQSRRRAS